jgi:hypothetical protein
MAIDDMAAEGIEDHDFVELQLGKNRAVCRIDNCGPGRRQKPSEGTIAITARVGQILGQQHHTGLKVEVRRFPCVRMEVPFFVASTKDLRWDIVPCSPQLIPDGPTNAEIWTHHNQSGSRPPAALRVQLIPDPNPKRQSEPYIRLNGMQREALGLTGLADVDDHSRKRKVTLFVAPPVQVRGRVTRNGIATLFSRPFVGELVLPAQTGPVRPALGASSLVMVSREIYAALGLQSGDRIRCRSGARSVVRRVALDESGTMLEPVQVDAFVREDLAIRDDGDVVGFSRDPTTAFSRAFGTNAVPALLAFLSITTAQTPYGDLTVPAIAASFGLFYVAFAGERSRLR